MIDDDLIELTPRQREIVQYLRVSQQQRQSPPTLSDICSALGLSSRGSLHKHIEALQRAKIIEPIDRQHRGIRLRQRETPSTTRSLPLLGKIAAGLPIEAIEHRETISVPDWMCNHDKHYVLQIRGDSMIDEGIFDGDYVLIEQTETARNGQIVVALIDHLEATLKRIEFDGDSIILHAANVAFEPQRYERRRVNVQGVLRGLFRSY